MYFEDDGKIIYQRKCSKQGDEKTVGRVMDRFTRLKIVSDWQYTTINGKRHCIYEMSSGVKTRELYEKSGSALEMYTCLAAYECCNFKDCQSSVLIDLNGIITNIPADPRNEIDVVMIYNHTPIFVSCKNTQPTKEFLYEISNGSTIWWQICQSGFSVIKQGFGTCGSKSFRDGRNSFRWCLSAFFNRI